MFAMPGLALNVFAELSLSGLAMGTEAHPPATKATTTMQNPAILLNIDSSLCLKSIVSSSCDSIFYEEARVVKSSRGGRARAGRQTRRVYPVGTTRSSRKTARRAALGADLRAGVSGGRLGVLRYPEELGRHGVGFLRRPDKLGRHGVG